MLLVLIIKNALIYCATRANLATDITSVSQMMTPHRAPPWSVIQRGECEFLKKDSKALLRSCGMGSRKSGGREPCLHSHLNEGFGLDWSTNSNRYKLWARRFTAITDCYALRFILSYEGPNPVILRLQMRLMLWAMDLYHKNTE